MTSVRPRRAIPSSVNTPVSVKIGQVVSIDNSEAQLLLDEFLAEADSRDAIITTANTTNISQLKRCQRELRGLTPLLQDTSSKPPQQQQPLLLPNKKIKFDEEEEEVKEEPVVGKIDKEERKRLKKERRKEERKKKLEEV